MRPLKECIPGPGGPLNECIPRPGGPLKGGLLGPGGPLTMDIQGSCRLIRGPLGGNRTL